MTSQRPSSVIAQAGLSCSTLYSRVSEGLWPRPANLGARAVGWLSKEVDALNAARIAGHSNDEVRALVIRVEAARRASDEVV